MDRKGLELSMTIIVLLIISIIIFIGGIAMVWKMFGAAEEIKGGIDLQTKSQLESLLSSGNEVVALPINTKQVAYGKEATFGLGIRNIEADQTGFNVMIALSGMYDAKQQPIGNADPAFVEANWLGTFRNQNDIYIGKNKFVVLPLYVKAGTMIADNVPTPRGITAVFNVCVCAATECGECTPNNPAIYGKIRQIFLQVK
jgi:hypothetical protein